MRKLLLTLYAIRERIRRFDIMSRPAPPPPPGPSRPSAVQRTAIQNALNHSINVLNAEVRDYSRLNGDLNAINVSSHLLMRHTQLEIVEQLTREHQVHSELEREHASIARLPLQETPDGTSCKDEKIHPAERAYRLAVTDLFVEKAQGFLEERAISYQRSGKLARWVASTIVLFGAVISIWQMKALEHEFARSWLQLTTGFVRAFTAYGFIVLAAVGFWRYSKSMLDQAERLYERRHSLRQGRLFVHLKSGSINIDEMERAFRWSESPANAFAEINTEASAPWGGVAKEMAKGMPEIVKAAMQKAGKDKSEEKEK